MSRRDAWRARPVLGACVRVVALLLPVLAALAASVALTRLLPAAHGLGGRVLWWTAVLVGSTVALLAAERACRRLLPLAVLLELALVFPDRAPSRLRSVRGTSVRALERRVAVLREQGGSGEPLEAAETLVTLVGILGLHDKKTRGHSERVRAFTDLLTAELALPEVDRVRLRWAALVHDLGKLTIPKDVLNSSGSLSADQWAAIRLHPEEGVRLVAGLMPWLGEWGRAVVEHHERYDGTGYPHGLAGDQISLAARIVAVADSFEVMTAHRSYSRAVSAAAAREELARCAGTQFDPGVVRAFLAIGLRRLTWVLGPVSWLAQLPVLAAADKAGQVTKAAASSLAVGALVAAGVLPGPAGMTTGGSTGGSTAAVVAGAQPAAPVLPVPTPAVLTAPRAPAPVPAPVSVAPVVAVVAPAVPPAPAPSTAPTTTPPAAPTTAPTTQPSPTAAATPVALPITSSPSPTPTPSATPSPTPSASVSATPTPTGSPTPAPVVPVMRSYFLGAAGTLAASDPPAGTPDTVTLQSRGGAAVFDLPEPDGTTLSGTPALVLYDAPATDKGQGNAQGALTVDLQDCTSDLTTCTTLATGEVQVGQGPSQGGYQQDSGSLPATDAVLAPGHVLRLQLALSTRGNAATVVVAFGSSSTPSRVDLTTSP